MKCKFLNLKLKECKLTNEKCALIKALESQPDNHQLINTFVDCYVKNQNATFWQTALYAIGTKLHNGNGYNEILKNPLEPNSVQKILSYLKECNYNADKAIIPQLWTEFLYVFNLV